MSVLGYRCWGIKEKQYLKLHSIHLSTKKVIVSTFGRGGGNVSKHFSEVILEQDTGLRDKNGISIYEGDLVRNCDRCHVDSEEVDAVKVTDDAYLLPFRSSFGSWSPELCEVIGNIHEEEK